MVPPRAVNTPTLRRTSLNSGTAGAGAGACAKSGRGVRAPTNPNDDNTTKSRRFKFIRFSTAPLTLRRCSGSSRACRGMKGRLRILFANHVRQISVVLFADAFDEIRIRLQPPDDRLVPRLGVGLRIVDRDLDVHTAHRRSRIALGNLQRFGAGEPAHVEPRLAVLHDGRDDELLALPVGRSNIPSTSAAPARGSAARVHR